jgi:hypothetical protein
MFVAVKAAKIGNPMAEEKYFTLEEARALLPELRSILTQANEELDLHAEKIQELNRNYEMAEKELDACQLPSKSSDAPNQDSDSSIERFRKLRADFESCIEELSREQSEFLRRLEFWVDKIDKHGVILRKLKEGLLDFPACRGDFKYYLCWKADEDDITHWHLLSDGFVGRRSLVSLSEYY